MCIFNINEVVLGSKQVKQYRVPYVRVGNNPLGASLPSLETYKLSTQTSLSAKDLTVHDICKLNLIHHLWNVMRAVNLVFATQHDIFNSTAKHESKTSRPYDSLLKKTFQK